MNALPRKVTAYSEYVFSNLPQLMAVGEGMYNINELAQMVSLKPTGNFRRRVKQLVSEGKINVSACFTGTHAIEARYWLPNTEEYTGSIPF